MKPREPNVVLQVLPINTQDREPVHVHVRTPPARAHTHCEHVCTHACRDVVLRLKPLG